jgi:hypothetical protein
MSVGTQVRGAEVDGLERVHVAVDLAMRGVPPPPLDLDRVPLAGVAQLDEGARARDVGCGGAVEAFAE